MKSELYNRSLHCGFGNPIWGEGSFNKEGESHKVSLNVSAPIISCKDTKKFVLINVTKEKS